MTQKQKPLLVSVQKIWGQATHNALTDLIVFKNKWFCVFREAEEHQYSNGSIRLLSSENGVIWNCVALFEEEGLDLRDPKLSITPDGKLMLLVGASHYKGKKRTYHHSLVSFSSDSFSWSGFIPILKKEEWLWRVTWYQGIAYGVSYRFSDPKNRKKEWETTLWKSQDGIDYQIITEFKVPGKPNETTLRFFENGQMLALMRRDAKGNNKAWIGTSFPPYEDWLWSESKLHFGGPNFLILGNISIWAAGRLVFNTPYGEFERTALAAMDLKNLYPYLILPSNGDCSYPGIVYHEGFLWLSYYSSHEENTAIYLAKVDLGTYTHNSPR